MDETPVDRTISGANPIVDERKPCDDDAWDEQRLDEARHALELV
jgi:hypothetical protein